jgi:hypothetical protein
MDLRRTRETLERAGVGFTTGLTDAQFARAEKRFGIVFPDDLREFLAFALPTGHGFHDWRDLDDPCLLAAIAGPEEGIWFDIQLGVYWDPAWGPKPDDDELARRRLREALASAPKLVPILGHRYMPDRPRTAGNPVLSVVQLDIIYYGSKLENYLHNEFHEVFGAPRYTLGSPIRDIEFWSALTS